MSKDNLIKLEIQKWDLWLKLKEESIARRAAEERREAIARYQTAMDDLSRRIKLREELL